MSLPAAPPRYASWSKLVGPIRSGDNGWPVYAVQCVVARAGHPVPLDGAFGPSTVSAVRAWQRSFKPTGSGRKLLDDGICGGKTQAAMLQRSSELAGDAVKPGVYSDGQIAVFLKGFTVSEGASVLAATNWYTPPKGTPGVDCGCMQERVYGPPFPHAGLATAFDPFKAMVKSGQTVLDRAKEYKKRRKSLGDLGALRAAILAHNAPFLAEQLVSKGRLLTPGALAVWTTKPGGGHYTHAQWAQEYPDRILGV